jgi:subtilisin family serine protease
LNQKTGPAIAITLLVFLIALALFVSGCGGGGGSGAQTVDASGSSGTTPAGTTTGGATADGGTTGGLNSTSPPPPPPLAIPQNSISAQYAPNTLIVKMREPFRGRGTGTVMRELPTAALDKGVKLKRESRYRQLRTEVVVIESGQTVEEAANLLSELPEVEYAEPDYLLHATETTPNDTLFGELWGHKNTGQSGGLVGADIDTTFAWDIQTGDPNIVIGFIDTGVDYNHPDLAANMWRNPGEDGGTPGVDDDNNGYVDDIFGINAIDESGDPLDDEGHGTHVAGIAAAVGNNNTGVVGVAFNTRVMALKFLNSSGTGTTSDAIECIEYAISKGAHITNNSWGGSGFSFALRDAIQAAANANQLFIAAAGNSTQDVDQSFFFRQYPAGFDNDNIISVGYSNRFEELGTFSNFGPTSVDLFAPGQAIRSTVPDSNYGVLSGTSMATPQVTGVAALLLSELGSSTPYGNVRDRILDNVDVLPVYQNKCVTGGRLNAHYALDPAAAPSPSPTTTPTPTPEPPPTPVQDSITLAAGWNLFSFPVGEVTELTIPAGIERTFWVWNANSQTPVPIDPTVANINAGGGTGRGFWVFAQNSAILEYRGLPTGAQALTLEAGWNLVGLPRGSTVSTDELTLTNLTDQQESILSSVACEDIPASPPCLLFQYFFFWRGSYANINGAEGANLTPKRAHWVYAWNRLRINFFPISINSR